MEENEQEYSHQTTKELTDDEKLTLEKQNSRLVSSFKSEKVEAESKKHWDLFYKRNDTRFFKDRRWTTREFQDLVGSDDRSTVRVLLEIGCGVGNFVLPLVESGLKFKLFACDISPRAVEFVQADPRFDPSSMEVFQADVTKDNLSAKLGYESVDICTLVFVLSAIRPNKFELVLANLKTILRPGGIILFRDYGLYDMAQFRFKPGHKIEENLYLRQDGTSSYFFSLEFLGNLFTEAGFQVVSNCYVHRRTINRKENIDVPRIFVQAKFQKPV